MFDKLQQAFWKALTPDLVPDEPTIPAEPAEGLSADIVAALGVGTTSKRSNRWR